METLTKQFSENDYKNDAEWKDEAIMLINNNHDRHFFNKLSVKNFGKNNSKIVITWKKPITSKLPISVKNQIYDEKVNPMLFGYFVSGAKAIITCNQSGNVYFKVSNGTKCIMHEISQKDKSIENKCINEIKEAEINGLDIVDISTPPDFIIFKLINQ